MSTELKHTPEPWDKEDFVRFPFVKIDRRSIQIDDFSRAVACVNACAAMPNPSIYIDALKDGEKAWKKSFELADIKVQNYIKQDKEIRNLINADTNESTYDEVERLKNQRDTLLAALVRWQEEWEVDGGPAQKANNYSIEQQIKAAIAKAKRGNNG